MRSDLVSLGFICWIIFQMFISTYRCEDISSTVADKCQVTHEGKVLNEGESIEIKGKIYKVEDCSLNRAYHACGTHLFYVLNIVCQALEQNPNAKQQQQQKRSTKFLRQKPLTEACCLNLCTVAEMARYCP